MIGKHLQVFVRDNNVEQALKVLKRKMQHEGVFREMKRRKAYEKPSERKTREKAEAIRRVRKAARKQAQRDGLIPMPKPREDVRRSLARSDHQKRPEIDLREHPPEAACRFKRRWERVQCGGLLTLKNPTDIDAYLAIPIGKIAG
jgi:small subunit ribosomal protein S21